VNVEVSAKGITPIPGTEKEWPADLIILAMGFMNPESKASGIVGLCRLAPVVPGGGRSVELLLSFPHTVSSHAPAKNWPCSANTSDLSSPLDLPRPRTFSSFSLPPSLPQVRSPRASLWTWTNATTSGPTTVIIGRTWTGFSRRETAGGDSPWSYGPSTRGGAWRRASTNS
jgi:hypothetical protein